MCADSDTDIARNVIYLQVYTSSFKVKDDVPVRVQRIATESGILLIIFKTFTGILCVEIYKMQGDL